MENIKEIEQKLCDLWNKHRAIGMSKAMPSRRNQTLRLRRLKKCWEDFPDFEVWEKVFKLMGDSPWYSGHNPGGWVATFSWLCQSSKFGPLAERSAGVAPDEDIASEIDDVLGRKYG